MQIRGSVEIVGYFYSTSLSPTAPAIPLTSFSVFNRHLVSARCVARIYLQPFTLFVIFLIIFCFISLSSINIFQNLTGYGPSYRLILRETNIYLCYSRFCEFFRVCFFGYFLEFFGVSLEVNQLSYNGYDEIRPDCVDQ